MRHAIGDDRLREFAPLFTTVRPFDVLAKAIEPRVPALLNGDGEEVVFRRVRIPLARGARLNSVAAALGRANALRRDDALCWNRLGPPPAPTKATEEGPDTLA